MFITSISQWISEGQPTALAEQTLNELNNTRWLSSMPDGWVLIGENKIYGVAAFYDDNQFSNKTIHQLTEEETFSQFDIPQSYVCWPVANTYVYEAFTRRKYRDTAVASNLLFLAKCYLSNQGKDLHAPAMMSEDADLLYKNVCDLYGEPYKMDQSHIVPMPLKLFTPWGGRFVK